MRRLAFLIFGYDAICIPSEFVRDSSLTFSFASMTGLEHCTDGKYDCENNVQLFWLVLHLELQKLKAQEVKIMLLSRR